MGGLFDTLAVGANAIGAQQRGAQVAGHNIANASTPGHHRQETLLQATSSYMGVRVLDVRRAVDPVIEQRLQAQVGLTSFADRRADALVDVEAALGDLGDSGLGATLDRFFAGFRELSVAPNDPSVRQTLLARADSVAGALNGAAINLQAAQGRVDVEIGERVTTINSLAREVATLNRGIVEAESTGASANTLRDQREVAVQRLAEEIGATAFEDDRGQVTVVAAGISLVQGDSVRALAATPDATTGLRRVETADGVTLQLDRRGLGGALGALLEVRDQDIPGQMASLDAFAFDLATAVNGVHQAGVGLDGVAGRPLFAPLASASGAAGSITLDAAMVGAPDRLAAALDPAALPGDGRNAQTMAQLQSQMVASSGTRTITGALADIVAGVGQLVDAGNESQSLSTSRLGELQTLHESVSGVSIEEQMLALSRYQRAFEAASKVVRTVDEMLETLINM